MSAHGRAFMTMRRSSPPPRRRDLIVTRRWWHRRMRIWIVIAVVAACSDSKPADAPAPAQPVAAFNRNAQPHAHRAPKVAAGDHAFWRNTFAKPLDVPRAMELGAKLFRDPALSASGKQACSSCHDPANAFAPSTDLPVQPGGKDGIAVGMRAAPSLRYLQLVPAFSEHFHDSDGD